MSIFTDLDGLELNFVDIGSSGQTDQSWSKVKSIIRYVGFDPNEEECIVQNSTHSEFRSAIYLPYAIHAYTGKGLLFKTRDKYCYSLLKPNKQWLERFAFKNLFEVVEEEWINVKALKEINLTNFQPDILKIDVQGLELDILSSDPEFMNSIFCLETENGFVENYIGETTFADMSRFLSNLGFIMFDINVNHRIPRDNCLSSCSLPKSQILWAESMWLKDYISLNNSGLFDSLGMNSIQARKTLIICAVKGCFDYGFELAELFMTKKLISYSEYEQLSDVSCWSSLYSNTDAVLPKKKTIPNNILGKLIRRMGG